MTPADNPINYTDRELLLVLHTKVDSLENKVDYKFNEFETELERRFPEKDIQRIDQKLTEIETTMKLQKEYSERQNSSTMRWVGIISILLILAQIIIALFDWKLKTITSN